MPPILRYFLPVCGGILFLTALIACDSPETVVVTEEQPEESPDPSPQTPDDATGPQSTVTVEGVRVSIPERWQPAVTGSTFTAVQYTVPGTDPSLDATFTISNPIGGGLMYNALRWDRQFRGEEATTETWVIETGELQIMEFEGRGDFDTGLPGSVGVQEDMAVLGAIPIVNGSEQIDLGEPDEQGRYPLEIDQSATQTLPRNIFIKLTGPAATVDAAREEWDEMLRSLRIRDVSSWATP